ncbi:cytochrome c oxidase assembly protein [Saccharospirillum alexandrii]|nr:cytochrome c oxidase assembly protein [Saccharospirillum alexandrii]
MYLLPYEFSWLAVVFFGGTGLLFVRGQRVLAQAGTPLPGWRIALFWLGFVLAYSVMHTQFDYFAQFMFFIHRIQHLVLHHLAAILLMASNPWKVLSAGFPEGRTKHIVARALSSRVIQIPYRIIQFPPLAGFIFVGLIFFWLMPEVHFKAMLSQPLYLVMNWSMFLDGILFWWLILDPRSPVRAKTLSFGKRIIVIWFVTVPQLGLGAYIVTSPANLYDIYDLCGRAWPIAPHDDQVLGGVLTWIPPGMMGVLVMVVLLRRMLHQSEQTKVRPA